MPISPETLEEIWRLRDHLRQRLVTVSETQVPETLYHYTDAAGLLGIVSSGVVWATHYEYLNDASEFRYGRGLMEAVIEEVTADAEPDSWKARFRHVISRPDDTLDWAGDPDEQQFVACFSEYGDGLGQWRGYGKSIGGYSLGFSTVHFGSIENRINSSQDGRLFSRSSPRITLRLGRCLYDRQAQKALITEALGRALSYCARARYPVDNNSQAVLLGAILDGVSPFFKDPAFEDEHEWRLVATKWSPESGSVHYGDLRERTQAEVRMDDAATVRFRKGEYSLVPYVELPVVFDTQLSLSQVVVGPTPLPENARAAAMLLLRPVSADSPTPLSETIGRRIVCADVISSSIPFRRV